jgi:hypothetical protein
MKYKKKVDQSALLHMLNSQLSEPLQLFGYSSTAIYSQKISEQFNDMRSYARELCTSNTVMLMYCLQLSIQLYEKAATHRISFPMALPIQYHISHCFLTLVCIRWITGATA